MELFPDFQTLINIGPLSIKWYAVFILIGAALVYFISVHNFKQYGYKSEIADDLLIGCLIAGVFAARIWYVLFSSNLDYYFANPLQIFAVWQGGLAIQGGLFGGAAYGYYYCKKKQLNFMVMADMIVPNILLAQAIGRWGNFMNQEAYGKVVSEAYYTHFPDFIKNHMYILGEYREPTFLYESVGNILGFILIAIVLKYFTKPKRGDLVFAYLMWYGVVRFFVEGLRTDSLMFMGVRTAQVISIVFIIFGAIGMSGVFRKYTIHKPTILFDFDGTLIDTQQAIIDTYREMFRKFRPDYTLTKEEELSFIGPALKDVFPKYFKEDVNYLIEEYRTINFELHHSSVKPIEGAIEILKELKAQGYRIGVVSSKLNEGVVYGAKLFKMDAYFDVIIGLDDVKDAKPSPEGIFKACDLMNVPRSDVIYVGDSVSDIKAGKNANAFTIGFIFDENRRDALLKSKPSRSVDKLTDILEIVKENNIWSNNMM